MNAMKLILPVVLLGWFASSTDAQPASSSPSARESIEWCDIWISHANETNLPRVLLIGDSITRAYYPEVEKHLEGKAYVARLSSSAFISDPALFKQIEMVLGGYKFDVIHFNNGMHGWQHQIFKNHPEMRTGCKTDLGGHDPIKRVAEAAGR